VQPFISGAISKTVNVPKDATPDDIMQAYIESWRLGVKAIAIYRDGSKRMQPLNTSKDAKDKAPAVQAAPAPAHPVRRKLPEERQAITHKFDIQGHEGYITVGLYEDGMPGELFLVMAKEGSTISGFADAFAQAISYALQYGVPLQVLADKFSHMRFEPSGMTKNPQVRFAKSIAMFSAVCHQVPLWRRAPHGCQCHRGDCGRAEQLAGRYRWRPGGRQRRRRRCPRSRTRKTRRHAARGSIMVRSGSCYA
jgi:ribonucleotide reductase alpha subunit